MLVLVANWCILAGPCADIMSGEVLALLSPRHPTNLEYKHEDIEAPSTSFDSCDTPQWQTATIQGAALNRGRRLQGPRSRSRAYRGSTSRAVLRKTPTRSCKSGRISRAERRSTVTRPLSSWPWSGSRVRRGRMLIQRDVANKTSDTSQHLQANHGEP